MKPQSRSADSGVRWILEPVLPLLRVILIGLMLSGVVMVGFGVKMLVDTRSFLATAHAARGVVVRVDKYDSTESGGSGSGQHPRHVTHYLPFVEFAAVDKQVAQFRADDGSLRVGDSVGVLYDPANLRNARLDNWGNHWSGVGLAGGGLATLVVSGVLYLLVRRWQRGDQGAIGGRAPARSRVPSDRLRQRALRRAPPRRPLP